MVAQILDMVAVGLHTICAELHTLSVKQLTCVAVEHAQLLLTVSHRCYAWLQI